MTDRKGKWGKGATAAGAALGACACLIGVSDAVAADSMRQVTGKVVKASPSALTVQSAGETLEIERGTLPRDAKAQGDAATAPKVGDEVTVWYTLDARKLEIRGHGTRQEPGSAADAVPGEVIEDDRVFYGAQNDTNATVPRKKHGS